MVKMNRLKQISTETKSFFIFLVVMILFSLLPYFLAESLQNKFLSMCLVWSVGFYFLFFCSKFTNSLARSEIEKAKQKILNLEHQIKKYEAYINAQHQVTNPELEDDEEDLDDEEFTVTI